MVASGSIDSINSQSSINLQFAEIITHLPPMSRAAFTPSRTVPVVQPESPWLCSRIGTAFRRSGSAVLRLFYDWHGIGVGDREVKVWGLERDLFYPARFSFRSIIEWASGIRMLNAFRMSPERMHDYVRFLGEYHPLVLRGYSANLYELALFVKENKLHVRPPRIVVSSAGTLYDHLRKKITQCIWRPSFQSLWVP